MNEKNSPMGFIDIHSNDDDDDDGDGDGDGDGDRLNVILQ
jgi:hypothetical protein